MDISLCYIPCETLPIPQREAGLLFSLGPSSPGEEAWLGCLKRRQTQGPAGVPESARPQFLPEQFTCNVSDFAAASG